ncbi:MAG: polysaccharide biosynthesis/export family protein [Bacteroidota bacterium]
MNFISNRSYVYLLSLLLSFLFSSCASKKEVVYFQDTIGTTKTDSTNNYNPVFRTGDFLSINVTGLDPEAVKPFNFISSPMIAQGYVTGSPEPYGYLIDSNGMIDFPVLGKIKMAGSNRMEATALLKKKLEVYVPNPIIIMRILNFKVTVLGDVQKPGTFLIPNERITLLEVLGLAGDMNITGKRTNVLVIRDVDGKKTETRIDLTSKEIFTSPVYYLSQNDVVYVEPNRAKRNSSMVSPSVQVFLSIVSLILTTMILIKK